MPRIPRPILLISLGALIVAALVWTAIRPVPVPAELVEVGRGPMQVTLDVDGVTRIREVWEVSSPIAGTARRSPVRVGDPVVGGETLVGVVEPVAPSLLDRRSRIQAEAAVHEAEAALVAAESRMAQALEDLNYAKIRHNRAQALVERGIASQVRLEDAAQALKVEEAARDAAISARLMAQSTLDRARAALIGPAEPGAPAEVCCVEIRAPASGVVLAIDRLSARPVAVGERLLSIGDPADLEIVADPLSRDAVRIPDGATANVERWGGPGALQARLRRIEPSAVTETSALGIEEQRVEAIFDFIDPPGAPARLGDGYAVRLRIVLWQSADALQVPVGALFRDGAEWAAFALRDGRARLVVLRIGERNDRTAQVIDGLTKGDVVITHPSDKVVDGAAIDPLLRE